ncbi:hypothetical protein ACH4S8_20500 [Streptomyces sp. NPDC021080]|uniref:hypothetical protein n=1 Tax=Streptomyces sp. NPDC021080 TaxID=3365110 RepID=UPI003792D9C8
MKPEQDPERNPSREPAATKGRVTPVPAGRSPDGRAKERSGGAGEVPRREALKGRAGPASAEPATGAPDRDGAPDGNGGGPAVRPAGTGTPAGGTTGTGTDGRGAPGDGRTGGAFPGGGPADPGGRAAAAAAGRAGRMLPLDEQDKFSLRMRHAVGGFIDGPRASVEEADQVLEELAGRFTEAVTRRRRDLRTSWQSGAGEQAADPDTERLRLALRDYRELTERLLRL